MHSRLPLIFVLLCSPLLAADINNDQNASNDHPGFARNSFNYPLFISLDPRITKEFAFGQVRLQLIAEAFNVLNRSNVSASPANASVGVRNNYYRLDAATNRLVTLTNFGEPLASAGPRIIQLAAKVIF